MSLVAARCSARIHSRRRSAQATFKQLPVNNPDYVKPYPPVKILSNLYFVHEGELVVEPARVALDTRHDRRGARTNDA